MCCECFSRPFFKVFFFLINWRIISLQCCVSFCHTTRWISHKYRPLFCWFFFFHLIMKFFHPELLDMYVAKFINFFLYDFWTFLERLLLLLLSRFSRVRLCATPETAAHQAPPSLGFSKQEHWSGLPFPSPMHESEKWKSSRSVVSDS